MGNLLCYYIWLTEYYIQVPSFNSVATISSCSCEILSLISCSIFARVANRSSSNSFSAVCSSTSKHAWIHANCRQINCHNQQCNLHATTLPCFYISFLISNRNWYLECAYFIKIQIPANFWRWSSTFSRSCSCCKYSCKLPGWCIWALHVTKWSQNGLLSLMASNLLSISVIFSRYKLQTYAT